MKCQILFSKKKNNLHEVSDPIFKKKKKNKNNITNLLSDESAHSVVSVKQLCSYQGKWTNLHRRVFASPW